MSDRIDVPTPEPATPAPALLPSAPAGVVHDLAATHAVAALDSRIAPLLTAAESGGGLSAFHVVAEPRSGPPLHLHRGEEELLYVLAGTLALICGGRRWTAGPGTLAHLPKDVPHTWANLSPDKHARLLVVCRPGGFEGYLLEVAARHLDAAADAAELQAIGTRYGIEVLGANPLLARAAGPDAEAGAGMHAA